MPKAKPKELDFREAESPEDVPARTSKGKLASAKQVRARARRTLMKGKKLNDEDFELWAGKPIDEWDLEELARGRTRDKGGGFRGRPPMAMPRAVHERIADRFKLLVKDQLNIEATSAIGVIHNLLNDDNFDDKGKPIVPASVKLDAAKWLVEHVIGKPVQPTQSEVSVKLQGILSAVTANPILDGDHPDLRALPPGYAAAHFGVRGGPVIDAEVEDDDDDWGSSDG